MSGPVVLRTRDLRFSYEDGTPALRGVDFELGAGESVSLLGPNGSGKTTFLLHLNGILRGEGEVEVCGLPVVAENLRAVRRKVGLLFQDPEEQLFLPTVLEDVAFGPLQAGAKPEEAEARAKAALQQVDMAHDWNKPPYHLSAGEKQRVALAGLLAAGPEVLVLDEPTTHLDPPGRRHLVELLRSLPQAKIIVTHDTAFARALATRAVFFEGGKVVANGPVEEIVERYRWDLA